LGEPVRTPWRRGLGIALVVLAALSNLGAGSPGDLSPAERCERLIRIGEAGAEFARRFESELGEDADKSDVAEAEVAFATEQLELVRELESSPPPKIATEVRLLADAYEQAAEGDVALYESKRFRAAGRRIGRFVTNRCNP
jgi:hypothetical protein